MVSFSLFLLFSLSASSFAICANCALTMEVEDILLYIIMCIIQRIFFFAERIPMFKGLMNSLRHYYDGNGNLHWIFIEHFILFFFFLFILANVWVKLQKRRIIIIIIKTNEVWIEKKNWIQLVWVRNIKFFVVRK